MAEIPNFEDFKKQAGVAPKDGGGVPSFEEFKSANGGGTAMPSLTPGTPNSDAAGRFAGGFASAVNPVPGIRSIANDASDPQIGLGRSLGIHLLQPQLDQFGKAADAATGRGEFEHMTVPGRISSAAGHTFAGALPLVGPAAANAGEQIGEGDVAGGLGSGAGLIASGAAPDIIRGTGRALMRTAEPIAENAIGVRNVDRGFGRNAGGAGRTPGRAALDETTAMRPGRVAEQAQARLGDIDRQLQTVVGNSQADTHLQSARDKIARTIGASQAANSEVTPQLQPMSDFLTKPQPGFTGATSYPPGANTPITITPNPSPTGPSHFIAPGKSPLPEVSEVQTPSDMLRMKRQFSNDFIRNWNPTANTKGQLGVAREGYHEMANDLHRAVPESKPLDVRSSSLIPVAERAGAQDLNAGPIQNGYARFAAKTGALVPAMYGLHEGGIAGGLAGIAAPLLLADPTAQMITARGLDLSGKAMSSPIVSGPTAPLSRPTAMPVGRAIQAAPLLNKPKKGEQ